MHEFVFRNDDVNSNSDFAKIRQMYDIIREHRPEARIISCVSLFSKANNNGTLYPDLPLRGRNRYYFYNVDLFLKNVLVGLGEIASHGLVHIDHSKLSYDAQEMSILTSCKYLKTNLFCAPFSGYNEDTLHICKQHDIELLLSEYPPWISLERNMFTPEKKNWYFHSWRMSLDEFKKKMEGRYAISSASA